MRCSTAATPGRCRKRVDTPRRGAELELQPAARARPMSAPRDGSERHNPRRGAPRTPPKVKPPAPAAPSARILARFRHEVRRLQRDARAVLVGPAPTTSTATRSRRQALVDGVLSGGARLFRSSLEPRTTQASAKVESRAEFLLTALEVGALNQIRTLLERLDIPSRRDLDALTRRVRHLEKLLHPQADQSIHTRGVGQRRIATRKAAAPTTQRTAGRSRSLKT